MTVICFVDVETTGTEPVVLDQELWEIGLIRRDLSGQDAPPGVGPVDHEYAWQVYPDLRTADPTALRINQFYRRCQPTIVGHGTVIKRAEPRSPGLGRRTMNMEPMAHEIAADLARLLDGAILVAINVDFDAAFIAKFLRTHGQCPTWDYHKVEALSLAAGHLHLPPPWSSTLITERLGVPAEKDRHTGLGDTRIVRDIFDAVYRPLVNAG